MKVAILFDAIEPEDVLADRDVLQQVKLVVESLKRLGHTYTLHPCSLDLGDLKDGIVYEPPDVCFNLLDTLDRQDCLSHLPIALLDALRIRHTGPDAISLSVATRKLLAKDRMIGADIPTPIYLVHDLQVAKWSRNCHDKWIIKAENEDGSFGMTDESVVEGSEASIRELLSEKNLRMERSFFAEEYIVGREFTVPFLCGKVLPVVEVTYNDYPEGKPKILAQAAKWQPESFESKHTGTAFPIESRDTRQLQGIASKCMSLFNLKGWGRIDFRVGENEGPVPYVIDVNANSCLAPDAWWAESLAKEGITFDQAITEILAEAI